MTSRGPRGFFSPTVLLGGADSEGSLERRERSLSALLRMRQLHEPQPYSGYDFDEDHGASPALPLANPLAAAEDSVEEDAALDAELYGEVDSSDEAARGGGASRSQQLGTQPHPERPRDSESDSEEDPWKDVGNTPPLYPPPDDNVGVASSQGRYTGGGKQDNKGGGSSIVMVKSEAGGGAASPLCREDGGGGENDEDDVDPFASQDSFPEAIAPRDTTATTTTTTTTAMFPAVASVPRALATAAASNSPNPAGARLVLSVTSGGSSDEAGDQNNNSSSANGKPRREGEATPLTTESTTPMGGAENAMMSGSTALFSQGTPTHPATLANPPTTAECPAAFRKIRLLGTGAFGAVYLALNVLTGELLAAKEIRIADMADETAVRDVLREISVMSRLPIHPNCTRYIGTRNSKRVISILMEYVSGGSVESLLRSGGRFHEATIRHYAYQALCGLQHLHRHGVVHQDIKGGNVLIDNNGVAKIADFGCCTDLSCVQMNGSKAAGSPLFMAPEVCRGNPADQRSDIWSYGCLLLEMAKDDHRPWSGFSRSMSLCAVIYAISSAKKPPDIPAHLSPAARDFLQSCLQLDAAARAPTDALLMHRFFTEPLDIRHLEALTPVDQVSSDGGSRINRGDPGADDTLNDTSDSMKLPNPNQLIGASTAFHGIHRSGGDGTSHLATPLQLQVPVPRKKPPTTSSARFEIDDRSLAQLISMGVEPHIAQEALVKMSNDLELAIDWAVSHAPPGPQPRERTPAAVPPSAGGGGGSKSGAKGGSSAGGPVVYFSSGSGSCAVNKSGAPARRTPPPTHAAGEAPSDTKQQKRLTEELFK